MEPFFTFLRVGLPPHELRELTLDQVAEHLDYYNRQEKKG